MSASRDFAGGGDRAGYLLAVILGIVAATAPMLVVLVERQLPTPVASNADSTTRLEATAQAILLGEAESIRLTAIGAITPETLEYRVDHASRSGSVVPATPPRASVTPGSSTIELVATTSTGMPVATSLQGAIHHLTAWSLVVVGRGAWTIPLVRTGPALVVGASDTDLASTTPGAPGTDPRDVIVTPDGASIGPRTWPFVLPGDSVSLDTMIHDGDRLELDLDATRSSPSDLPSANRIVGTWRIAGISGGFGPDPGTTIPFAGVLANGAGDIAIDTASYDGPPRITLAGSGVVHVGTSAPGAESIAGRSPLAIEAREEVTLILGGEWHPHLAVKGHQIDAKEGFTMSGVLEAHSLRVAGTATIEGSLLLFSPASGQGVLHLEANEEVATATLARLSFKAPSWCLLWP